MTGIFTNSLASWEAAVPDFQNMMTGYGTNSTALGSGSISYPNSSLEYIGYGWATWSGDYTGEVVWAQNYTTVTINLSGLAAFGFQVEPNPFSITSMTITLSDGEAITEDVNGYHGAQFFGFTGGDISSVTITSNYDFAFGNFFYSNSPSGNFLFTANADVVDFNNLMPAQQAAITAGADIYNGLGGSDVVTLPNESNYSQALGGGHILGWTDTAASTFHTESKVGDYYKINGGDGSYHIVEGAGTELITISGNGDNTITAGSGTDTISITGNGNNTINGGTGNDFITFNSSGTGFNLVKISQKATTLNLQGSKECHVTFTAANEKLTLPDLSAYKGQLTIDGFTAGDQIFFSDEANLTTCATYAALFGRGVPGELDVYSGIAKIATLIFDGSTDASQIEPINTADNGTNLVLDPSNVASVDYEGADGKGQVDWNFLGLNEGHLLIPYVPTLTSGNSGVTIATGIDLANGQIDQSAFAELFPNFQSDPNLNLLYDATSGSTPGPKLQAAVDYLNAHGQTVTNQYGRVESISTSITPSQANVLDNKAKELYFDSAEKAWNGVSTVAFQSLPSQLQTVIVDFRYNAGHLGSVTDSMVYAASTIDSSHPYGTASAWSAVETAILGSALNTSRQNAEIGQIDQLKALAANQLIDGYIANATVFADANGNGKLDPGEVSGATDATGRFTLNGGSGPLVAFGGVDGSTGVAFQGEFSAPDGSVVITPLTTLLNILSSDPSGEQMILASLGLSSTLDLTTFDPIAAANAGSADGTSTEVAGAKVYDTISLVAAALTGLGSTFPISIQDAFAALAAAIDGSGISLTNQADISGLITGVAQSEQLTLLPSVADDIASIIVASNTALDHALSTDVTGGRLLLDTAAIELAVQGAASNALEGAVGNSSLRNVVGVFTGDNLANVITHAQDLVQNPGENQAPIAFDGVSSTDEDTALSGSVAAIDLNGDVITYALDGTAPSGLVFHSDGTFSFDPTTAFDYLAVGEDATVSFRFAAEDGQVASNIATESITITGVNDNPIAAPDSNATTKNSTLFVSAADGVLSNDTDPDLSDRAGLFVSAVGGSSTHVGTAVVGAHGSLILNADGSYIYQANKGSLPAQIVSQDTFNYTLADGHGGTDTCTLSIVVTNPNVSYLAGVNTTLNGGNGADVLDGSAGHDVLIGDNGPDVLIGGDGNTMTGGNGPDMFLFRPNFGINTITDFNAHSDVLQFDASIFTSVSDLFSHTSDIVGAAVIDDGHGDSVVLQGVTSAQLHAHSDILLV